VALVNKNAGGNVGDTVPVTRIIMFSRGTMGDIYPFLRIGNRFKELGCEVTLISNYCYESYAIKNQFDFVPLDDEKSFEDTINNPELYKDRESKERLYEEHILVNIPKQVGLLENKVKEKKESRSVIVANSNDILTPMLAAEKCNVPIYLCVLSPSYIYGLSMLEGAVSNMSGDLNSIRNTLGLEPIEDWKKWVWGFSGCFAFWPSWFSNDVNEYVSNIKYVGFLSIDSVEEKALQQEIKDFISGDSDVVLLTHSTSKPFDDNYFKIGIEACENLNCKVIVSTTFRDFLPKDIPKNVLWVEFCSFHELLPYVSVIIHHGGIGTVREAIANRVPQLIVGRGFDRQDNGKIVKKLMLGEWIPPKVLNVEIIRDKLERLLEDEKFKSACIQYEESLYMPEAIEGFYNQIMQGLKNSCLNGDDGSENFCKEKEDNMHSPSEIDRDVIYAQNKKAVLQRLLNDRARLMHVEKVKG
jgi:rhamnosyltransferase subunit B